MDNVLTWAEGRLRKLGWLAADASGGVAEALAAYQRWAEIGRPGTLDPATVRHLEWPRFCGHPDVMDVSTATGPARWQKTHLLWNLQAQLPGIDTASLRQAFSLAWSYWAAVCGIDPVEAAAGQGGDVAHTSGTIDGPGNVLAYSELPNGTDRPLTQTYDSAENWAIGASVPPGRIDLVRVCCHEIGHALGLEHAPPSSGALMAPVYNPQVRQPQTWDIEQVQSRYGPSLHGTPPPPPPPGGFDAPTHLIILGESGKQTAKFRLTREE